MTKTTCQWTTDAAAALLVVAPTIAALAGPARAARLPLAEFTALAKRCAPQAAPSTMAAIARVESGFDPLTIHDNTSGASAAPATAAEAIAIATSLLAAGHSLDLGIMQINSANLSPLGLTVSAAFDACRSITASEAILAGDYTGGTTHEARQAALRIAISKYNTGSPTAGFTNGYVAKVEAATHAPAVAVSSPPAAPASPGWDVYAQSSGAQFVFGETRNAR